MPTSTIEHSLPISACTFKLIGAGQQSDIWESEEILQVEGNKTQLNDSHLFGPLKLRLAILLDEVGLGILFLVIFMFYFLLRV